MNGKLYLLVLGAIIAAPESAKSQEFLNGAQVIASPTMLQDRWERCTVDRYIAASNGYEVTCKSVTYVVPARYVLDATEQNAALLIPEAARDLMPAGTEVVASPTYLPDRWERCLVVRPLYEMNGYELNCSSVLYVVSRTQVLPATQENLKRKLTAGVKNSTVLGEQGLVGGSTVSVPGGETDPNSAAVNTPNGEPAAVPGGYFPGMMIEASPLEGVWGDAVVIEQVADGFRVQMLPGLGYDGAPQLILRSDQVRQKSQPITPLAGAQQATEPANGPVGMVATQQVLESEADIEGTFATEMIPNGTYYCGKSTGGMVFFMGEIELRDGFYRGPAYDGQFGDWYPMETTTEGTINWRGPLGGFESDISRVASTAIKSDGGNPSFDVILQMASGNFMGISCVPK